MSNFQFTSSSPLRWPDGVKRTAPDQRKAASFGTKTERANRAQLPMHMAVERLTAEVSGITKPGQPWRTQNVMLSTNVETTLKGTPRSGQRTPDDPGACLYFKLDGVQLSMPCDKWLRVEDNIAAIAKHINAVRMMEQWGVGEVSQMFVGFSALPAPQAIAAWWDVLGMPRDCDMELVRARYRSLAKKYHPDSPEGDTEKFNAVAQAYDQAAAEKASMVPA
jgi:hypothetical protein